MGKNKSQKVRVKDLESEKCFTGRFIGLINEKECNAIINTKDAADKIWTAESLSFDEITFDAFRKRFVVVTSDDKDYKGNRVFISPKIAHMVHSGKVKTMTCKGGSVFEITPSEE